MSITEQRSGLSAGVAAGNQLAASGGATGLHAALHHPARLFALYGAAGACVVLVGSLGPWMTMSSMFHEMSTSGLAGDGSITLVLALIALGLGGIVVIGGADDAWLYWIIAAMGAASTVIATMTLLHINAFGGRTLLTADPGWGVMLTFVASACVAVLGIAGACAQSRLAHRRLSRTTA